MMMKAMAGRITAGAGRARVARALHQASSSFQLSRNVLEFPDQTVFAGTEALADFVEAFRRMSLKKPLIVTDKGIAKLGLVSKITEFLRSETGVDVPVFDQCEPNPGIADVKGIAEAFIQNKCDSAIGLGGGGPLDATKGGLALVAQMRVDPFFSLETQSADFIGKTCRQYAAYANDDPDYVAAIPPMCAVPTTSGTGSDGGKSAVICDEMGTKVVFGHPKLMPLFAALVPQFTAGMPGGLTAATGIDAIFHSLEAYLVPTDIMINRDKMTMEEIEFCDSFALMGIELACRSLKKAVSTPDDLQSRLEMQISALYGAKAFRKGDLGGVHAAAHAIGARYHLHHGACIARMSYPVLNYSENKEGYSEEAKTRSQNVKEIISGNNSQSALSEEVKGFVNNFENVGVKTGIKDIIPTKDADAEIAALGNLAGLDGCQTNPIALDEADYTRIFALARQY